jgi:excisionase family DNA binding protein
MPAMTLLLHACRAITVPTAAAVVGVSTSTLYRWCREGAFPPAMRVGNRWLISWPLLCRHLAGESATVEDYNRTIKALRANGIPTQAAIRAVGRARVQFSRLPAAECLPAGAATTSRAARMLGVSTEGDNEP